MGSWMRRGKVGVSLLSVMLFVASAVSLTLLMIETTAPPVSAFGWIPDFALTVTAPAEAPVADFTISVSPTSATVKQGKRTSATVTVENIGNYNLVVSLSASGQPSGVSINFRPSSGVPTFSSTMTINVGRNAPVGTHTITIKGTGEDGKERTCVFILTITAVPPRRPPDFKISVGPKGSRVILGGSTTATVTVTAIRGYSYTVSLTASGQPSGVTVDFSPSSDASSFRSTMKINVDSDVPLGTHTITIKGEGEDGKERTCVFTLAVKETIRGVQNKFFPLVCLVSWWIADRSRPSRSNRSDSASR